MNASVPHGVLRGARIGVVEDHDVVAMGLHTLLDPQPDLHLVAAAHTVSELLDRTRDLDVVLLDLRLADGSPLAENIARLRATDAHVLAYTSGEDPALLRAAARADVHGIVVKSASPPALLEALRQASRGEVVASLDWAAAIDSDPVVAVTLTAREREVLSLYASGEKADRVGHLLGISRETVLDHVRNIRAKYAAASRPAHTKVDLYRRAVEDGVLNAPR